MRGLLVRVGIDSTSGNWNAPVDSTTRRFIFIPIPDCPYNPDGTYIEGGKKTYETEILPALEDFSSECGAKEQRAFGLPENLHKAAMHLDPDFGDLTYGDDGRRGKPLKTFVAGDFVAFFAGLRPIIELGSCVDSEQVADQQRLCNAHCRWTNRQKGNVVVIGESGGILERCIPIGTWREKAYRVTPELLKEWGGFKKLKNGYLQRSARLPEFEHPEKFMTWFRAQKVSMSRDRYRFKS